MIINTVWSDLFFTLNFQIDYTHIIQMYLLLCFYYFIYTRFISARDLQFHVAFSVFAKIRQILRNLKIRFFRQTCKFQSDETWISIFILYIIENVSLLIFNGRRRTSCRNFAKYVLAHGDSFELLHPHTLPQWMISHKT